MIRQEIEVDVIGADWTDDCRVSISAPEVQDAPVAVLTITEAKAFRSELDVAIAEAAIAADDLRHEHEPASFDVAILSPDCRDGNKHRACIGTAWDQLKDELTNCTCECHAKDGAA